MKKPFSIFILMLVVVCAKAQKMPSRIFAALSDDDSSYLSALLTTDNLNECYGNYSLLSEAVRGNAINCFNLLIEKGVDVNKSCNGYVIPLMHAAKYGRLDMVKVLVEHGADVNYKYNGDYPLAKGKTPVTYAEMFNHQDIANYLIGVGAKKESVPNNITDGPYVFHRNGWVITKNITVKAGITKIIVDSFKEEQKTQKLLNIMLQDHPEWNFNVKLKMDNKPRLPVFGGSDRMLVVSDIEGEFEYFRSLLLAANVINENYNWTFGTGKLIVAGDLFDRGKQVSQCLWLLYKLEDEAREKGGDVNVVLGNHDIMNLQGDFRYVNPEYFANARLFKQDYSTFYNAHSELGEWLRSKNTIEKIGDLLVLHGGVSSEVLCKHFDLTIINEESRPYYDATFKSIPDRLQVLFGDNALFWYRGYFIDPRATQDLVDSTLAFTGVKKLL